MLAADLTLLAFQGVLQGFIFVAFVLSGLMLTVVVLLQEGKGGGLGSAFGGAAADAFGVKAGTVNRFTAYLAASFLGLALLYLGLSSGGDRVKLGAPGVTPSLESGPSEGTGEPADTDVTPPAKDAEEGDAPEDGGAAPGDGTPTDGGAGEQPDEGEAPPSPPSPPGDGEGSGEGTPEDDG